MLAWNSICCWIGLDKASLSGDWARWARGSTARLSVMWNGLGKDGLGWAGVAGVLPLPFKE